MPLTKFDRSMTGSPTAAMSGYRVEEHLERDVQFEPGQVRAEAVVRTGAAERDVVVGCTRDVEHLRIVEDRGIAVGGRIPDDDLVALR